MAKAFPLVVMLIALIGGMAMGREWTASAIISAIETSGLAEEINAVIGLEAASEGYGPGEDERIEIRFAGGQELFAYDGAGGTYHLLGDGRILLVDSEGTAGVVAPDFESFIGITTGLPDWRSALAFMGNETLAGARLQWAAFLAQWNVIAQQHQPWPYYPELFSFGTPHEARAAIADYFTVSVPSDPFAALYKAVDTLNDDVSVWWEGEIAYPVFGRVPQID